MHGQPPGRPPGPSTDYPHDHPSSGTLPIPTLKIDDWSIFKVGMGITWRPALIPYFESRSVVDFAYRKEGFGGFEADRLWDRISIRIDVIFNSTKQPRRPLGRYP